MGEHSGEAGLSLLRRLNAMEWHAPIVFAGASQRELIARAVGELQLQVIAPDRLSAVRARVSVAVAGGSRRSMAQRSTWVSSNVVGVPPALRGGRVGRGVSSGTAADVATRRHTRSPRLNAQLPRLWPPGPTRWRPRRRV